MATEKKLFGIDSKGTEVYAYTITNSNGMSVTLLEMGAVIQSLMVPDKDGKLADVVLGFDTLEQYEKDNSPNYGACIGRCANRIGGARFVIDGKEYHTDKNDGENTLHNGFDSYITRVFGSEPFKDEEGEGVIFSLVSPDKDQGMPGELQVTITIVLTEDNAIIIEYEGVSSEKTVFNMTNHSYFNLAGHNSGNVYDQMLWLDADEFTPSDAGLIPTGEFRSVAKTPMDFRTEKAIGQDINADYEPLKLAGGYDHNYVLKTNGDDIELVGTFRDPKSGRKMEIYTDLPGIQVYSANFVDGTKKGKEGCYYQKGAGICFESQYFPDSVNKMNFKSPVIEAGVPANTVTVYKFV